MLTAPLPEPEPEAKPVETLKPPEPEPEPEPEPPPPPPKPKPKPEKKPEPKPKVVKKEEKKPPPKPKKEPKPEAKPKAVAKPPPEKPKPQPEVVAKAPPPKTGIQEQQLPSILNAWGRMVQRKVEKNWLIPGGIPLTEANREVHISFWVDRDGNLIGYPQIIKDAVDPSLGESGIRSILMAEPLPPLPMEYREKKQQVVYVFSLVK